MVQKEEGGEKEQEDEKAAAEATQHWEPSPPPVWGESCLTTPAEQERTSGVDCGRLAWETR